MIVKYGKQIKGVGHYALVEFEIITSNTSASIVVDRCTWKRMKDSYDNFVIGDGIIKFKESVIKGMYYGISRMINLTPKEINLIDIALINTDTSNAAMFIVGVKSIFKGMNIELTKFDQELIDKFVSENYIENNMSNYTDIGLQLYP